MLRTFIAGVSYAKFLAFDTPNPKKKPHEMFYMCCFFFQHVTIRSQI